MLEKDIIGINFEFSRNYTFHLYRLFEDIPILNYSWYVSCSENFQEKSGTGKVDEFLPNGVYSGPKFASTIKSSPAYYVHLLRLFAVPEMQSFNPDEINTYMDFEKSNAKFALLSADSIVDFYSKDYDVLLKVYGACKRYYDSLDFPASYITLENDSRTGFYV